MVEEIAHGRWVFRKSGKPCPPSRVAFYRDRTRYIAAMEKMRFRREQARRDKASKEEKLQALEQEAKETLEEKKPLGLQMELVRMKERCRQLWKEIKKIPVDDL